MLLLKELTNPHLPPQAHSHCVCPGPGPRALRCRESQQTRLPASQSCPALLHPPGFPMVVPRGLLPKGKNISLAPPVIETLPGAPGGPQDKALSPWLGVRGLSRTFPLLPPQLLPSALSFSHAAPPSRSRPCSFRLPCSGA